MTHSCNAMLVLNGFAAIKLSNTDSIFRILRLV